MILSKESLNADYNSKNGSWIYSGNGYKFKFKNDNHCYYQTLIVRPAHLEILQNETEFDTKELLVKIIEDWFEEENQLTKDHNNAVRRKSREKKNEQ